MRTGVILAAGTALALLPLAAAAQGGADALVRSAEKGDLGEVQRLLDAGADPNAQGSDGRTPLYAAVLSTQPQVVKRLLEKGANPNGRTGGAYVPHGTTPLSAAASTVPYVAIPGSEFAPPPCPDAPNPATPALLASGADPNLANDDGVTPLMLAANTATVRTLLDHGARFDVADRWGRTAFGFALADENCSFAPARVLLAAGARPAFREACTLFVLAQYKIVGFVIAASVLGLFLDQRPPPPAPRSLPGSGDSLPRLQPLKCAACGAPVPIARARPSCPSCGVGVPIPEDYRETLALRARSAETFRRAAKAWRRAWWLSSPAIAFAFLILAPLGVAATAFGLPGDPPVNNVGVRLIAGLVIPYALGIWGVALLGARKTLARLPRPRRLPGGGGVASCSSCGAPVAFAARDLVATCGYCGGDLYRARLARGAHAVAAEDETRIAHSLYDVLETLREGRRLPLMSVVGAVALIVFALVT